MSELYPAVYKDTELRLGQAEPVRENGESLDTAAEMIDLELRYHLFEYVQDCYGRPDLTDKERALAPITSPMHAVEQINNQFAKRLYPAYSAHDPEEGLVIFRSIVPHTTDEELALLITDEQFLEMSAGAAAYVAEMKNRAVEEVNHRLGPKGYIQFNDGYQFQGRETKRSLESITASGISVEIAPDAINEIKKAYTDTESTHLPMIEVLKNKRIITVNGFKDSKVSLAVHDAIDHAWGFQLLQKYGLDDKFSILFESIGDPASTDIFKREGEIIASIGFGVRYGSLQENGFKPLVSATDIKSMFNEYFVQGQLKDIHMEALRILQMLPPDSRESLSLGFTYSNYIAELDEQRRKHGKIKTKDLESGCITGELSEVDPDFLSLFIELHHQILDSTNKHRDTIFRFHILLEDYLQGVAKGDVDPEQSFNVKIQELAAHDYSQTTVSPEKLKWMFSRFGFSATKHQQT